MDCGNADKRSPYRDEDDNAAQTLRVCRCSERPHDQNATPSVIGPHALVLTCMVLCMNNKHSLSDKECGAYPCLWLRLRSHQRHGRWGSRGCLGTSLKEDTGLKALQIRIQRQTPWLRLRYGGARCDSFRYLA